MEQRSHTLPFEMTSASRIKIAFNQQRDHHHWSSVSCQRLSFTNHVWNWLVQPRHVISTVSTSFLQLSADLSFLTITSLNSCRALEMTCGHYRHFNRFCYILAVHLPILCRTRCSFSGRSSTTSAMDLAPRRMAAWLRETWEQQVLGCTAIQRRWWRRQSTLPTRLP